MSARQTSVCLDTVARPIYRSRKFDHVMPLLHDLHLLRIPERITFVLAGGFGLSLSEWTCTTVPCWWPAPGGGSRVTATAAFGADCGTDHQSRDAFHDRAFNFTAARVWNSFPLSSSACLPVSESILTHFYLLGPSRHSNTFLRFILSPSFILRLYVFFYYVFYFIVD